MKKMCIYLLMILLVMLTACKETLPERIGDSYYIEYTIGQNSFTASPKITYLEMFGLEKTTVSEEKDRVEKRGESFKMTCEFYFQSGCFDNISYTVTDLEEEVKSITKGNVAMLKSVPALWKRAGNRFAALLL